MTGTFSHRIDLTARLGVPKPTTPRSLVGQLQGLPGAAVFTYDYHPYSGRWVTDEHIGPGLAETIECLGEQSGNQVVLIGHSMGGLAIRQALAQAGVPEHVAGVITVGTPHTGSLGALAVAILLGGAQNPGHIQGTTFQLFSTLITHCGALSTEDFEVGGICGALIAPLRAFHGEAGRALRAGSPEITALPTLPPDIPFYPIAGRAEIEIPGSGWFGFVGSTETIDVGDIIVTSGSALPEPTTASPYDVNCAYRLNVLPELGHSFRLVLGVLGPEDQTEHALHAFGGACFHGGLLRGIEVTNEIMGITYDHVTAQTRQNHFSFEDSTGYVRAIAFGSPSGNILCEFSHFDESWHSTTCWIGDKEFTVPPSELMGGCYGPSDPPPPDSDELVMLADGSPAEWAACRHDTPHVGYEPAEVLGRWALEDANWIETGTPFRAYVPVLEYGQSLQAGDLTCSSASDGVTCLGLDGTGFTLSRNGWARH